MSLAGLKMSAPKAVFVYKPPTLALTIILVKTCWGIMRRYLPYLYGYRQLYELERMRSFSLGSLPVSLIVGLDEMSEGDMPSKTIFDLSKPLHR